MAGVNYTDADILASLDRVGRGKAIGYLPLNAIIDVLRLSIDEVRKRYEGAGLSVVVFSPHQTCINSGALFVYDPGLIERLIPSFKKQLSAKRWSDDPHRIVARLARSWFANDDDIMPFIRALYADAEISSR